LGYGIAEFDIQDDFRICLQIGNAKELYSFLYANNIVCEFADDYNLILIPSVMNTTDDFDKLTEYCGVFKDRIIRKPHVKTSFTQPQKILSIRQALFTNSVTVGATKATNQICADIYAPYPPGIPIAIPGELLTGKVINILENHGYRQIKIIK
jgi:lysine decarboxylase